jgi:hypothetical protein
LGHLYGQVALRKRLNWFNQMVFVATSAASFQVSDEKIWFVYPNPETM